MDKCMRSNSKLYCSCMDGGGATTVAFAWKRVNKTRVKMKGQIVTVSL